jgi:hypothetical protein
LAFGVWMDDPRASTQCHGRATPPTHHAPRTTHHAPRTTHRQPPATSTTSHQCHPPPGPPKPKPQDTRHQTPDTDTSHQTAKHAKPKPKPKPQTQTSNGERRRRTEPEPEPEIETRKRATSDERLTEDVLCLMPKLRRRNTKARAAPPLLAARALAWGLGSACFAASSFLPAPRHCCQALRPSLAVLSSFSHLHARGLPLVAWGLMVPPPPPLSPCLPLPPSPSLPLTISPCTPPPSSLPQLYSRAAVIICPSAILYVLHRFHHILRSLRLLYLLRFSPSTSHLLEFVNDFQPRPLRQPLQTNRRAVTRQTKKSH